jgi:hypothetical protein
MLRLLQICVLLVLMLVPRQAMGFSLLGVLEGWQVERIGHNLGGDVWRGKEPDGGVSLESICHHLRL